MFGWGHNNYNDYWAHNKYMCAIYHKASVYLDIKTVIAFIKDFARDSPRK